MTSGGLRPDVAPAGRRHDGTPPAAASGPAQADPAGRASRRRRWAVRLAEAADADTVLFDPPGPRGRRRIAVATVLSLIALAALAWAAEHQFAANGQLAAAKWRLFGEWPIIRYLLKALLATVKVTLVSGAIALPIGVLLALGRLSRTRLVRWPAAVYTEVMRAVPLLLLIYAVLLGLPSTGLKLPLFWELVWPIALTNAAILAEIFRAGVLAVARGQSEAAFSLGLRYWPTMRTVIIPQAVRQVIPALVSQLVRLLKDSTLGYVVSYVELLYTAGILGQYNHTVVQSFLVVTLVYIVINNILAAAARRLERRLTPAASPTK
jgi:glutamate transport system permease protein